MVTLNADGDLIYDSSDATYDGVAAEDLLLGEKVTDSFTYTVETADGDQAEASVNVDIAGAKTTVDAIDDVLVPESGGIQVIKLAKADFQLTLDTGEAGIDGVYDKAYCLDFDASFSAVATGEEVDVEVDVVGSDQVDYVSSGQNQASPELDEDLDNLGWILNEDFGSQGYTETEIQAAIWGITNLTTKDVLVDDDGIPDKLAETIAKAEDGSTLENALEIYNRAVIEGEGYEATEAGDIIALVLTPTDAEAADGNAQPFLVGIEFEDLPCEPEEEEEADDFLI